MVELVPTVRITSRPQQVMTASSHIINPVALQAVTNNRHHGPQVRQTTPQPIENGNMAFLQLPRPAGPKAFSRIVEGPEVQITNLGAFGCGEAANAACWDGPCMAGSYGDKV